MTAAVVLITYAATNIRLPWVIWFAVWLDAVSVSGGVLWNAFK